MNHHSMPTTELNMRCAGVKRLLKEASELHLPNELFCARPMEDNLFEWHFTFRGPPDTVYANGVYHGRIVLPAEYPMKPPNLILLTPNGRFEVNTKICLSISGYHPETWLPSWSIRTALLALIGFMPTHSAGAVGGLECSDEERKKLALRSLDWHCEICGVAMKDALPKLDGAESSIVGGENATATQLMTGSKSQHSGDVVNNVQSGGNFAAPAIESEREEVSESTIPPHSTVNVQTNAAAGAEIRSSSSALTAMIESPILWISVLTVLFLVLFCRRIVTP